MFEKLCVRGSSFETYMIFLNMNTLCFHLCGRCKSRTLTYTGPNVIRAIGHDNAEWQHRRRMVQNNGRSQARMSSFIHSLQYFHERTMSDALEEHDGNVSIGGRNITNLRFADDIDALAEEEQNLETLLESSDKTCTMYKIEIRAEKTKLMTNSDNGILREIEVKDQKLGTLTSFKYLGVIVSYEGSKPKVLSRIAQAAATLTKLRPVWRDNHISRIIGETDALPCHVHISLRL